MQSFEKLGVCRQLAEAAVALGWKVPTSIQEQAVPHLLAGGFQIRSVAGKSILRLLWRNHADMQGADLVSAVDVLAAMCRQRCHRPRADGIRKDGSLCAAHPAGGKPHQRSAPLTSCGCQAGLTESALPMMLQGLLDKPQALFALVLSPTRELAIQIAEQFEALGAGIGVRCAVLVGGIQMMAQAVALGKRPHIIVGTPGRVVDHLSNTKVLRPSHTASGSVS